MEPARLTGAVPLDDICARLPAPAGTGNRAQLPRLLADVFACPFEEICRQNPSPGLE